MALILRVDIDKPYGHHSLWNKILSKLREDYFFPAIHALGYLKPSQAFLSFCNKHHTPAVLYFRNCTVPDASIHKLINEGDYLLGFHAENTRSFDTFKAELEAYEQALGSKVTTFTKHGSGTLKLGKHHYAPFEPDRYKEWAKTLKLDYSLGNGITDTLTELYSKNGFYNNMFWLEHHYRRAPLDNIDDVLEAAKTHNIVLVIHPANFYTYPEVRKDLEKMIIRSKEMGVKWLNHIEP